MFSNISFVSQKLAFTFCNFELHNFGNMSTKELAVINWPTVMNSLNQKCNSAISQITYKCTINCQRTIKITTHATSDCQMNIWHHINSCSVLRSFVFTFVCARVHKETIAPVNTLYRLDREWDIIFSGFFKTRASLKLGTLSHGEWGGMR